MLAGRWNGAAVVYLRIVSLLEAKEYADCNVLANVIAHELGHLLLRSPQHGAGIMKAHWDAADFDAMKQKRLQVSSAEVRKLRISMSVPGDAASVSTGE